MMLIQLADRLAKAKGKKQYGYLNAGTKKLVDAIVAELAGDSRIQELYSLWYKQKEDVLRTYTNKMPERIPLACYLFLQLKIISYYCYYPILRNLLYWYLE